MTARTAERMTAVDVVAALRRRYGAEKDDFGPEWGVLDEFSDMPGGGYSRIDLLAVRAWAGRPKGHERHAIEVKVSRSDLLTELRKPEKAARFDRFVHRFFLATPVGLVRESDPIPETWGVIEVQSAGTTRLRRKGVRNDSPDDVPEGVFVEAFRRASRSETRIRRASDGGVDDPAALVPNLAQRVASAEAALHRARNASARDRERLDRVLRELASVGGWPCVCGRTVKRKKDLYGAIEHADGSVCTQGRFGMAEVDLGALADRLGAARTVCVCCGLPDTEVQVDLDPRTGEGSGLCLHCQPCPTCGLTGTTCTDFRCENPATAPAVVDERKAS